MVLILCLNSFESHHIPLELGSGLDGIPLGQIGSPDKSRQPISAAFSEGPPHASPPVGRVDYSKGDQACPKMAENLVTPTGIEPVFQP